MKSWIILLTLIFVLPAGGCAPVSASPMPASPTPDIMPRLDPSPTPSGSTLPLTCQVTDLNVYINEAGGYCFAYPKQFTLGEHSPDKPEVLGPAVDHSSEPIQAKLNIEVEPAALDKTLQQQAEIYLEDFSVMDPANFTWSRVSVGGETGWMVEPVPTMLAYRIVFIQHNGSLYRLLYWPVDFPEAKADLDELTQTTLGSFAFTK